MLTIRETAPLFRNLFDDFFGTYELANRIGTLNRTAIPSANISEEEDKFIVALAVPGFKKEEIEIRLEGDLLTIQSKNAETTESQERGIEIQTNQRMFFSRSFTLPHTIARENLTASYSDGILYVILPKNDGEASPQAKRIEIS